MEQLTLEELSSPIIDKKALATQLSDYFDTELKGSSFSEYISVADNKTYIAIKSKSYVAVKLNFLKKAIKLEAREKYSSFFQGKQIEYNDKKEILIVSFDSNKEVLQYFAQLRDIAIDTLAELGDEHFGCCSRYIECSDAKECIHPDKFFAFACGYKKNLDNGKIFYGKNKNI